MHLIAGVLRGFDGDAALLLVFARVSEAGLSGAGGSDDSSLGHQRVGQRRLPVVHVRDHRHVTDVGLLVHDGTDLVNCEVHLEETFVIQTQITRVTSDEIILVLHTHVGLKQLFHMQRAN